MEFKRLVLATMGVAMTVCVANAADGSVTEHLYGAKIYTDGTNNRTNLEIAKSTETNGNISVKANGYRGFTGVDFYATNLSFYGYQSNIAFQVNGNNNIGIGCEADKSSAIKLGGNTMVNGSLSYYFPQYSHNLQMTDDANQGILFNAYGFRGLGLEITWRTVQFHIDGNADVTGDMTINGKLTCHDEIEVTKLTAANMDVDDLKANDIKAKDINIELNNAADYVFEENYDLKSLKEVESYVKEHKHLPNVPSAAEIAKNGMSVSEMSNLFLEKIEELTLHMIQLQKENEALKAKVESMER